ncbi:MAG: DEAD/DEAH box helicase family protein [Saprospiraceae bacterium]|nr:DEAD/DEAH box helicase family protein [Saprospiraceae bacterium]
MLQEITFPPSGEYQTGSDWEPVVFHMDVLLESNHLDLLLGYFSSSAINVLALGFAKFLSNGGKVRMVINHILSEKDKEAILKGQSTSEMAFNFSVEDIFRLKSLLNEYGKHFFDCLAWLISANKITIKAIKPKSDYGIAHYKSGVFSDGKESVKFKSSCNYTASGLLTNLEELSIRCSWKSSEEVCAIQEYQNYYDNIFEGHADFAEYLPIQDVEAIIRNEFGDKNLSELLIQEKELLKKKREQSQKPQLRKTIEKANTMIETYLSEPRFPYPSGARDYQMDAYRKWVENGYQGIFGMATGTGKTITSLNCVLEEFRRSPEKSYRALILVPTITLVEQWEKEARSFNYSHIIKISSKSEWERELSGLLTYIRFGGSQSFILISTYASFYRQKFQSHFKKLPDDTILIADEGHNIASPKVLEALPQVHLKKRIGLSATPKRIYDPSGTAAMEEFFNDSEPYTYSFSMERAIEEGVLCQYKYFPHLVSLTPSELEEYVRISQKLMKLFDFKMGKFKESDLVEKLLLARKRVIHKAANKLEATRDILQQHFLEKGDLKFTFVYVPEGLSAADDEQWTEDEEELRLINQYSLAIGNIHPKIIISQFTSATKDRDEILKQFQRGDIHVVASMKCLDEGVDMPRAEFAIFCSSTGNPRQFIQRRGRVLRKHPDKHLAVIHDLVVVPNFEGMSMDEETFKMERKLVQKELERVAHFAFMSINRNYTLEALESICQYYDLNLHTIHQNLLST